MDRSIGKLGCTSILLLLPIYGYAQSYMRTETIVYSDNTAAWVLGQVAKTSVNGVVVSETTYDPATALPLKTYNYGKLKQTLTYNADGTLATASDGRDSSTLDTTVSYSNWKRGIPQTIAYPATPDQPGGESESAIVNDDGTIASVYDENGFRTCYTYDDMGRLSGITYPSETAANICNTVAWSATAQAFAPSTTSDYGLPVGHWKQTVQTSNSLKITHFDAVWRPIVEEAFDKTNTTQAANTHTFVVKRYDSSGNLAFQSYPLRTLSSYASVTAGTTTTYDVLDRAIKTSTPSTDSATGTFVTTTAYLSDADGPYTVATDAKGNQTRIWYQMFDQPDYSRPVKILQPENVITDISRDVFGKPLSISRHDSGNNAVSTRYYTYNNFQELCRSIEPETGATDYGYDAAGNMTWSAAGLPTTIGCSADGMHSQITPRRIDRTYDARSRLKTLVFPNHQGDTTTSYTPDGLVASLTTDNGSNQIVKTAYTYNHRRLATDERMTWGSIDWSIGYGYDAYGNLSNLSYPNGTSIAYDPNALGQPTQVGTYADYITYHPNGAIASFNYGNGIAHKMTQNDRQLPERSRDAYEGSATHVFALDDSYDYDGNGNVMAISDGLAGAPTSRTMQYDGLNRLTKATSPLFNDGSANEARYSYDVLDNLRTVHVRDRHQFYCYDETTWRLTNIKSSYCSSGATVVGLGYDERGNITNKNGQTYNFDFGNKLRSSGTPGAATYVYDGLGRRVRDATTASKYSLYSQDGRLLYATDARTGKRITNIYLGNSLIAELEVDNATAVATTRYMHTDALGSVAARSSSGRSSVIRNDYEPYGEMINRPNYDRPGYAGHVMDAATGLTYMQQRYYDPSIGRFLSVDPVTADANKGSNFNRYWYANNNPYRFTDPDGRESGCFSNSYGCGIAPITAQGERDQVVAMAGFTMIGAAVLMAPAAGMSVLANPGAVMTATDIAAGAAGVTGTAALSSRALPTIKVLEEAKGAIQFTAKGTKNTIEVVADISQKGKVLTLSGLHVEGAGKGVSGLGELRDAARAIGASRGATTVIIQGAERTTGANPGKIPIPITIKVDKK